MCTECEILQRKLTAAQNRIADDCESSEKQFTSWVALSHEMGSHIRFYRWLAAGAAVVCFVLGRITQ